LWRRQLPSIARRPRDESCLRAVIRAVGIPHDFAGPNPVASFANAGEDLLFLFFFVAPPPPRHAPILF
jgi:hypothetical protein